MDGSRCGGRVERGRRREGKQSQVMHKVEAGCKSAHHSQGWSVEQPLPSWPTSSVHLASHTPV